MKSNNNIPGYFSIIGFQRSGTTYLYDLLDQHPQVLMNKPKRPEPKFFIDQTRVLEKDKIYYLDTYFSELATSDQYKVYGDKSTSYCESPDYLVAMKSYFPEGKVILMIRNPTERALSNYKFSVANGMETRTMEEVFLERKTVVDWNGNISVNPFDYVKRGYYTRYIKDVLRVFPRDKVLFLCFDKVRRKDEKELKRLSDFLGIDFKFSNLIVNSNKSDLEIVPPEQVTLSLNKEYKSSLPELESITGLDFSCWAL